VKCNFESIKELETSSTRMGIIKTTTRMGIIKTIKSSGATLI